MTMFLMFSAPCAAVISKPTIRKSHECDEEALDEIACDICGFKSTGPDGAHYCCEDNSDD